MTKDLKPINVYLKTEQQSEYIGTVSRLTLVGEIKGITYPVTDKSATELYGERISGMISVTSVAEITVDTVLETGGKYYKVVSAKKYSDHCTAVCESHAGCMSSPPVVPSR